MIDRRAFLAAMAAASLLPHGAAAAQGRRVGGARIVLRDGRVWMQVRIAGSEPMTFIVDTGAVVNLIRRDVARRLALRELRPLILRGVGGDQQFTLYEGKDVFLGNIDIGDADFASYPGEDLPIHPEAAGALASSILTVADSDLDFEAGEWRIYPDGRGERPGYERLPSEIRSSARRSGAPPIHVEAAIDGRTYRLQVDTGAPGALLLWPEATRRSGLWNDAAPYAPTQRRGIGGVGARARVVRAGEARIGSIAFARPLVSIGNPEDRDARETDGIVGLPLLEQMNLSTDVRAGRLWAKRNARPAPPERYPLSGLWLDETGGRLVVAAVGPGSPAAEAGLAVGDEIVGTTLGALLPALGGGPGTALTLDYSRGGWSGSARMTLRPFL